MPVPDLTPYVDLRFYDRDPQDVFDVAVTDLQSRLAEWQPREGNIEVLLLEAMALQVAEAIFAVNRLPGAVVMALLRLYGVHPDPGVQPTTVLRFEFADSLGHDLPAGTTVRLDLSGGLEPVLFSTSVALAVPAGSSTGTVAAVGDRFTDEANGVAAETLVELVDAVPSINLVRLHTDVAGGVEPEDDAEWIERGVQRFSRLTETLVLLDHFEAAALENPSVSRAKGIDNWNGSTGAPGDHPGFVTVAVYGDGGPVPGGTRTELAATLEEQALAALTVSVVDPTVTAVPVTVSVHREVGYDDASVQVAVTSALEAFLNVEAWDWSGVVRRNELIAVIGSVDGVAYVETLTAPAADVVLPGQAALATAGSVTVTTT